MIMPLHRLGRYFIIMARAGNNNNNKQNKDTHENSIIPSLSVGGRMVYEAFDPFSMRRANGTHLRVASNSG